ncbi:MAG: trypsin-like serine protease [Planctomycetaceae bacterium]|nr:trypsin-like serine protease [Planctomycetaceae bacterium]
MRVKFSPELPLIFALVSCVFLLPADVSGQSSQNSSPACLYFVTQQSCPPCRQMDPVIERLVSQGYPVKTVHLETNRAWAQWANVQRTPTVIMLGSDDRIMKRFSGVIGGDVLQGWFANAGISPVAQKQNRLPKDWERHFDEPGESAPSSGVGELSNPNPGSSNPGSSNPKNSYERLALRSTVKISLNVASQAYVDYASGTSIYSNGNSSLILTCGHLFRESNGAGKISVIASAEDGGVREFDGALLAWDAKNRDVALVRVDHPGFQLPVNPIAPRATSDFETDNLFTLGCDYTNGATLGETYSGIRQTGPTIRQTEILRRSNYSGIYKFDIAGSPVQGRSGGGLFTRNGELIGVCNARICNADEGIYTGLDSVYWVIDKAGCGGLFDQEAPIAFRFREIPNVDQRELFVPNQTERNLVSDGRRSRVIIIIENESGESELIRVENPTSELLGSVRAFKESRQNSLKQLEITSVRAKERR